MLKQQFRRHCVLLYLPTENYEQAQGVSRAKSHCFSGPIKLFPYTLGLHENLSLQGQRKRYRITNSTETGIMQAKLWAARICGQTATVFFVLPLRARRIWPQFRGALRAHVLRSYRCLRRLVVKGRGTALRVSSSTEQVAQRERPFSALPSPEHPPQPLLFQVKTFHTHNEQRHVGLSTNLDSHNGAVLCTPRRLVAQLPFRSLGLYKLACPITVRPLWEFNSTALLVLISVLTGRCSRTNGATSCRGLFHHNR